MNKVETFGKRFHRKLLRREKSRQRGSGLKGFLYGKRFKPPENYDAQIRLIQGDYIGIDGEPCPYHDHVEHYNSKVNRSIICSGKFQIDNDKLVHVGGNCCGCHIYDPNPKGYMSRRQVGSFLIAHLDDYYKLPARDRDGNILRYETDGKYHKKGEMRYDMVHIDDAIEAYGSQKRLDREGFERVFGNIMHWDLGSNHLKQLSAQAAIIAGYCHCGGRIETVELVCPECQAIIVDVEEDRMREKQVQEMLQEPYVCDCGCTVMLEEISECDKCGTDADPISIFDTTLSVHREGISPRIQLVISKWKVEDLDPEVEDMIPEDPKFLERVFVPQTVDEQAKYFNMSNPFIREGVRRHVRDYSEEDADEGHMDFRELRRRRHAQQDRDERDERDARSSRSRREARPAREEQPARDHDRSESRSRRRGGDPHERPPRLRH